MRWGRQYWPRIALFVLGGIVACEDDGRLRAVQIGIEIPPEVDLGTGYTGQTKGIDIPLRAIRAGEVRLTAIAVSSDVFEIPETWVVPGYTTASLPLVWRLQTVGNLTATLTFETVAPVAQYRIPLTGVVLPVPDCSQEMPCHESAFDLQQERCVGTPRPDGVACDDGNACTTDTQCAAGECVGQPRTCPQPEGTCLVAICEPLEGCSTIADPSLCDDGNPCSENICTPHGICEMVTLENGTVCGALSCAGLPLCQNGACQLYETGCDDDNPCTYNGCMEPGMCVHLPVEDGTACGPASCDAQHVCRSGTCEIESTECDDGNICTASACVGEGECGHTPLDGISCDQGGEDTCWYKKLCVSGQCQSTSQSLTADCSPSVVQVALSWNHTCALTDDGAVLCWGSNEHGQLGRQHPESPFVELGSGRHAVQIAAGGFHTCALLDDASIKCWGSNHWGQLGLGDTEPRGLEPGQMGDALPAVDLGTASIPVAVFAGIRHSCALLDDATIKCWGYNSNGQLGLGDTEHRGVEPGQMGNALPALDMGPGRSVQQVAVGDIHTCALLDDGDVKCWGNGYYGQLGYGDSAARTSVPAESVNLGTGVTAKQIAVGRGHTCAVLHSGDLKCWGYNLAGQLGLGHGFDRGNQAGHMGDALPAVDLGEGRAALQVAAGYFNTCAMLDDGAVKCWGNNNEGQLGLGDRERRGRQPDEMGDMLPAIDLGSGRAATQVVVGFWHNCALLDDGTVKCWGANAENQTGTAGLLASGTTPRSQAPFRAPAGMAFRDFAEGPPYFATTTNKILHRVTWAGASPVPWLTEPVQQLVQAWGATCALLERGAVKCWGRNSYGQLGLGDTEPRDPDSNGQTPPDVDLGSYPVYRLSAGRSHFCALLENGAVKCWGSNGSAQLGLEDLENRGAEPGQMGDALPTVDLGTGRYAKQVAAGGYHTCALLDDASVKCWGRNVGGILGLGHWDTATWGSEPGQMGDALPAIDLGEGRHAQHVAAGGGHACVILDDGSSKCWGSNYSGALGLGDTTHRGGDPGDMGDALPTVDVGAGRSVQQVVAGGARTCALLDDGATKCWGLGQALGIGDTANRGALPGQMGDNLPSLDFGPGRVAQRLFPKGECALLDDGTVRCWYPSAIRIGDEPDEMGDSLLPVPLWEW